MNKKHLTIARIFAVIYLFLFLLPNVGVLGKSALLSGILGWIATLVFIAAPFFYFWLYRKNKQKGYLIASIITLLVLVIGLVAVVSVLTRLF